MRETLLLACLVLTTSCGIVTDAPATSADEIPASRPGPRATERTDALEVELGLIDSFQSEALVALIITNTSGEAVNIIEPGPLTASTPDEDGVATIRLLRHPMQFVSELGPIGQDVYSIAADETDHTVDDLRIHLNDAVTSVRMCLEVLAARDGAETGERGSWSGYTDAAPPSQIACSDPVELPRGG